MPSLTPRHRKHKTNQNENQQNPLPKLIHSGLCAGCVVAPPIALRRKICALGYALRPELCGDCVVALPFASRCTGPRRLGVGAASRPARRLRCSANNSPCLSLIGKKSAVCAARRLRCSAFICLSLHKSAPVGVGDRMSLCATTAL